MLRKQMSCASTDKIALHCYLLQQTCYFLQTVFLEFRQREEFLPFEKLTPVCSM